MTEQLFKDIYDEDLAKDAIINDRMEGFREDYLTLHCLLRKYNIKSCFEIGTHVGMGSLIIKNAMGNDSALFSLDLPDEFHHISKQHPLSEGKKGVGFECTLPYIQLRGDSRSFDYSKYPCEGAWIDGEHTEENVYLETTEILRTNPRIIIYHDADQKEVYEAIIHAFNSWNKLHIAFGRNNRYHLFRVMDTRILYALKQDI